MVGVGSGVTVAWAFTVTVATLLFILAVLLPSTHDALLVLVTTTR